MSARNGRSAGVRNLGCVETTEVHAANVVIYPTISLDINNREIISSTHHTPISSHQLQILLKTIVQHRNETPPDQEHDARIVKLVAPYSDCVGMIADCMEGGAHAQTRYCAEKEAAEYPYIFSCCSIVAGFKHAIKDDGGNEGKDGAKEMGVNVYSFVVQVAEALIGLEIGIRLGSVAGDDVVVVLLPSVDFVPEVG
jgi:hypothetical protein